jgi:hypothetical protein
MFCGDAASESLGSHKACAMLCFYRSVYNRSDGYWASLMKTIRNQTEAQDEEIYSDSSSRCLMISTVREMPIFMKELLGP